MKKFISLIMLFTLAFFLSGCGSPSRTTTPATNNPPAVNNPGVTPPNGSQPETVNSTAISIQNFSFTPSPLTIKVGTEVIWTNNESAPHQIKSDTFNSAVLKNGQNFKFTFSSVGEYTYSCSIHPSMQGKIIVTN